MCKTSTGGTWQKESHNRSSRYRGYWNHFCQKDGSLVCSSFLKHSKWYFWIHITWETTRHARTFLSTKVLVIGGHQQPRRFASENLSCVWCRLEVKDIRQSPWWIAVHIREIELNFWYCSLLSRLISPSPTLPSGTTTSNAQPAGRVDFAAAASSQSASFSVSFSAVWIHIQNIFCLGFPDPVCGTPGQHSQDPETSLHPGAISFEEAQSDTSQMSGL